MNNKLETKTKLEEDLIRVTSWCCTNSLLINAHKTDSGSACLGFGSAFFLDVAKWQLLHHPVRLCETERYKYANIHACFLSSLPCSFDQVVSTNTYLISVAAVRISKL